MPTDNAKRNNNNKPKKSGRGPSSAGGGKRNSGKQQTKGVPIAYNNSVRSKVPQMSTEKGRTVLVHREVLDDSFVATAAFGINAVHAVQPGISAYSHGQPVGQWLPTIAAQYDHYRFRSLKVHYMTSCATTQAGNIILCADPNPEGAPPATLAEARNMLAAVGPVRENLTLDITSLVSGKELLTRTGAVGNYVNYDAARIFVGSFLGTDAPTGYIEVSYVIELRHPQLGPRIDSGFVSSVAPPSVVFTDEGVASATIQLGMTTGTGNASGPVGRLLRGNVSGATSIVEIPPSFAIIPAAGNTVIDGVTYRRGANQTSCYFKPTKAGRYEVEMTIVGDFTDYATYAMSLIKTSTSTGAWVAARDASVDPDTGAVSLIPVSMQPFRGFSNPTVPGDDTGARYIGRFYAATVGGATDAYLVGIGIRNVTAIAENATAGVTFDPALGYGTSYLRITYLGAL